MLKWTAEYDEYLFKTQHLSAREIGDYLGITPHAVYQRRSRLGIKFHRDLKDKPIPRGETRKWPPNIRAIKDFIFQRDNYRCHYCGDEATQIDHIVPQSLGGTNITTNLVASCARCNNLKGNSCYECPKWREKISV